MGMNDAYWIAQAKALCEAEEMITQEPRSGWTALVDLDGTLANVDHRRRLDENGEFDRKFFHAPSNMDNDFPVPGVAAIVRSLHDQGWTIFVVSARSASHYKFTINWLTWNEIPFDKLIMRKKDDSRDDEIVKEDILQSLIDRGVLNPPETIVIDDRTRVVKMWRRRGLLTLQCAEGDY